MPTPVLTPEGYQKLQDELESEEEEDDQQSW